MGKESQEPSSESTQQIASMLPVSPDPLNLQKMTDILSLLSKDDALSIFVLAKDGIQSDLKTPSKLGLTKKQYYTRLKQLVDLGLLTKYGQAYIQTSLGQIIYQKHVVDLLISVKDVKQFEMIDVLKTTSKFSADEIENFMSKVGLKPMEFYDSRGPATITWVYDDMVSKVLELMEFATKEILLISRFTNELIINRMVKKANTGVSVKVLADTNLVETFIENTKGKIQIADKNKKERINVVVNPYYPSPVDRRYTKVPFCVLVVDNKQVGIEVVDGYEPMRFKMAMFSADVGLAAQMKEFFNNLWKSASKDPPQIVTAARKE